MQRTGSCRLHSSEQRYLLPRSRAGSSALRSTGSASAKRVPARSLKMELLQGSCRGVEFMNVFVRPVVTAAPLSRLQRPSWCSIRRLQRWMRRPLSGKSPRPGDMKIWCGHRLPLSLPPLLPPGGPSCTPPCPLPACLCRNRGYYGRNPGLPSILTSRLRKVGSGPRR